MPRIRAFAPTLALVVMLLAPAAVAGPLALHYMRDPLTGEPMDGAMGITFEDDGEVARVPGTSLDGLKNRVVLNATDVPGDGNLFLDTIHVQVGDPGVRLDMHLSEFTGRRLVYPGPGTFVTYHGWWTDLDKDDRIDLYHDALDHALDEFRWRGAATDEQVSMVFFVIPRNAPSPGMGDGAAGTGPLDLRTQPGAWQRQPEHRADGVFKDRTHVTNAEQAWVLGAGAGTLWLDESLLLTMQTVTVAGALIVPGSESLVHVRDEAAMVDVDRYESFAPETEALWLSAASLVRGPVDDASAAALSAASLVQGILIETLNEVYDTPPISYVLEAWQAFNGNPRDGQEKVLALAWRPVAPWIAKEPNHPEDDFEARAFLGAGDYLGTGNAYPGHETEYALWADAFPRFGFGNPAYLDLGPGGTVGSGGDPASMGRHSVDPLPGGGTKDSSRTSGVLLGFDVAVLLWKDANGDGWVGRVCNPQNPNEWDAANGRCASDPYDRNALNGAQPQQYYGPVAGESVGVCGVSSAKGGHVRVTPEGAWPPGTLLMRDYDRPMREAWQRAWRVLTGDEAVDLRLDSACGTDETWTRTIDQVLLPAGNAGVALRSEVVVTIPGFSDPVTSIVVGAQGVRDVDVLHPSL